MAKASYSCIWVAPYTDGTWHIRYKNLTRTLCGYMPKREWYVREPSNPPIHGDKECRACVEYASRSFIQAANDARGKAR